jgi:hypothetical protein
VRGGPADDSFRRRPITALATDVFPGDPMRFAEGSKALPSYVGIIPSEYAGDGRQRLGG